MPHNYNQILDGIQDQINDLEAAKSSYESQIASLQAELDRIPLQLADLEALKESAQHLSGNAIDLNINLNVNASGSNLRSHSTSVGQ